MGALPGEWVSEADFVCRSLAKDIGEYGHLHGVRLQLHLEEPIGEGRADLTMRRDGEPLFVVEAKIDGDSWHPDVVKEAFRYAESNFPFFCTCTPSMMVVFTSARLPINGALDVLYYDLDWCRTLFKLMDGNPSPSPLYRLLVNRGEIDEQTAEEYEHVWGFVPGPKDKVEYERPTFRLFAESGPGIESPSPTQGTGTSRSPYITRGSWRVTAFG